MRRRRVGLAQIRLFALASLVLCGCDGDQTGVPQPEPVPRISLLRATNAGGGTSDVELLGLPGAVPDVGALTVQTSRGSFATTCTAAGTFAVALRVAGEESITLRYEQEPPVRYDLRAGHTPGPGSNFAMPTASGPTVTFNVIAPAGSTVIVANFSNGAVVERQAEQGGAMITIEAKAGDELHVYVDGTPLSAPVVFTL